MISIVKKHWPLIVALGVLWITIIILLILSISQNQGHLIYALDDSYIHMSMAKNFAQYGIWGVDRYGFSSSSSSLLWTLLLSLIYFLFGANEITPFILNFIFGTSLVLGIYFILKKHLSHSLSLFFILLSIIFFTPLPSLIFSGLEHTMHAVISLFFIYLSAKILSDNKPTSLKYQLLILAPLLTMARFEGLFLVFVVCVLFLIRKKFVYSFLLGALALVPIIIYGAISTTNGWFFLPNSILLKGNMPALSINEISNFFYHFYSQLTDNYHILILLLACLVVFFVQPNKKQAFWKLPTMMTVIYIATTILHMLFAQSGWFFRYEAYLVALGIFVLAIGLSEYLPKKLLFVLEIKLIPKYIATAFLILLLFLALNVRGVVSLVEIPRATTNIFEQQYQMGLFLRQFYQGEKVATNDIGAVNYLADIKNLDLWGLASLEIAKLKMEGKYTTWEINNLTKQKEIKIAIVYDKWFAEYGGIPKEWIGVGKWKITNNIVCRYDTVTFYAVDPTQKDDLIKNLKTYSPLLSQEVMQSGDYTK